MKEEKKKLSLLLNFKYPKLFFLAIFIVLSYFIFSNEAVQEIVRGLGNYGYLGVFIAGLFFTFGFTSPISAGFFIILNPDNILFCALLGGVGALVGDMFIFKIIKLSFMDEFNRLKKTKLIKGIEHFSQFTFGKRISHYLLYSFAGFMIASPLPDEIGISILAGLSHIKARYLVIISLFMNTLGILVLTLI